MSFYKHNKYRDKKFYSFDENKILNFIINLKKANFIEIAKHLKIKPNENKQLTFLLKELISNKKIQINKDDEYYPIFFVQEFTGPITITAKRLGFLDFGSEEELRSAFVPPYMLKAILDQDVVKANIYSYEQNNETKYFGDITEIVSHSVKTIIGELIRVKNRIYFNAFDEKNQANFLIEDLTKFSHQNIENNLYKFNILDDKNLDSIKVTFNSKVASKSEKDYVVKKILSANEVQQNFPKEVVDDALKIPQFVSKEEIKKRRNLIDLPTVTIDGLDTKDFDDAISCYKINDNYKLFIHIADVSYYVTEGSEIDKEALLRGTSIYLPNKVIPMLPFELSNGICSLNPNEIRNCITLELEIDKLGNTIKSDIYESVIKSNYRLTYNEVNDFLDNKINSLPQEIKENIFHAYELSKIILKCKEQEGYIDFEIEEPKLVMDNLDVIDIEVLKEGKAEKLIEAFMVKANETVATMMEKHNLPSIYRVHDKPSDEKLFALQELLSFSKLNVNVPFDGNPKSFANMVLKLKEIDFSDYIKSALLRTMQKAIYSTKNIGHFGLGSKAYSHFTSPIRRYPDLILHRLIRKFIFNKKFDVNKYDEYENQIALVALSNSNSEKTAMQVERDAVDFWKSQFFKQFINKEFEAIAISIEKYGVFFNIEKFQTSVLVRFESITNDSILKVSNFQAIGKKHKILVGSKYKILIDSIDDVKGKINAKLVV